MSGINFHLVVGLAILVHGIGHSMGVLAALGFLATDSWHGRSWILAPLIGELPARIFGGVIFAVLTVIFVLSGLGFLEWGVSPALWQPLALIGGLVSLLMIFLYWHSFAALLNKAGAIFVNLALLYGILTNRL